MFTRLDKIADDIEDLERTVTRSRNRHREVTGKLHDIVQSLRKTQEDFLLLRNIANQNTILLEEVDKMYRNRHIKVDTDANPASIMYAQTLLESIRANVANYKETSKELDWYSDALDDATDVSES